MLFVERPITVEHIRQFCSDYTEGPRVEYKSTFDASVRSQLPKAVSSFANSLGGVVVVGVNAVNGVPQPPFEGFIPAAREELALTIENICLAGIHPPILPSITVVPSDVPGRSFLVLEIEEGVQAPHAIENSRKIYIRTGNSANPYDLADADSIINLLKRRQQPLEFRARLIAEAEQRSLQVSLHDKPELRVSICPTYPRTALCSSEEVWDFVVQTQPRITNLIPYNSTRRVPDGAASVTPANPPRWTPQYSEVSRYGLLFATKEFTLTAFRDTRVQQLHFGNLVHILRNLLACSELFYADKGYRGQVLLRLSLHAIRGQVMTFREEREVFLGADSPDDFRSYTDTVSTERLIEPRRASSQRLALMTDVLSEITWPFWQGNGCYPREELEQNLRRYVL